MIMIETQSAISREISSLAHGEASAGGQKARAGGQTLPGAVACVEGFACR